MRWAAALLAAGLAATAVAAESRTGGGAPLDDEALALLQRELNRCNNMMGPLRDGARELETKLSQCKSSLQDTRGDLSRLKEANHLEHNELEDLRQRARLSEDGLSDREVSISQLQRKIALLEKNTTQLVRLGQSFRTKNKELKEEVESALALLEYEKTTSEELRHELKEKGEAIATLESDKKKLTGTDLAKRTRTLETELADAAERASVAEKAASNAEATIADLKAQLKEKKNRVNELETQLEESQTEQAAQSEASEKQEQELEQLREESAELSKELESTKSELTSLRERASNLDSEKMSAEERAAELDRKQRAAEEESERLKELFEQYKEKVDDPALVDYFVKKAEWLKHPHVAGVDTAYEKTVKLLGPKLHPTHVALLEMQAMLQASSDRLSQTAGDKYSPLLSGLLTYGILLVPLGLTLGLLVRLKRCISLAKATMLMTLYNTIFCLMLFATSFFIEAEEPMAAFRVHNEQAFEFLQIMIPIYYCIFVLSLLLVALKFAIALRCKCSVRVLALVALPIVIMVHYYDAVWLRAMRDQAPKIEAKAWGCYSAGFAVLFMLITCCQPKTADSDSAGSDATLPLLDPKDRSPHRHGHLVSKAQEKENGHVINVSAEVLSPEDLAETAERVKEKANELVAAASGKSSSSAKKKKKKAETSSSSKTTKKKSSRRTAASENDDDDDPESRKVD